MDTSAISLAPKFLRIFYLYLNAQTQRPKPPYRLISLVQQEFELKAASHGSEKKWKVNSLLNFHLQEVEREISFRTECGLYYSYYKQMIQAASIQQGIVNCKVSFTSCWQLTIFSIFSNLVENKEYNNCERQCNNCTGHRFILFIHQGTTKLWT